MTEKSVDKPSKLVNLILLSISLGLAFLACEIGIRSFGRATTDGDFVFGPITLYPFRLPLVTLTKAVKDYKTNPAVRFRYDPVVGWTNVSSATVTDGLYTYDSNGIRSDTEVSLEKADGCFSRMSPFSHKFD